MAWQTVLTDNDFWKCSWAHAVIFMTESWLFLVQCCLWAQRLGASNINSCRCPLRTDMSPDFLKLLNIVWSAEDRILCNFVLRNIILKCLLLCLCKVHILYPIMLLTCCQLVATCSFRFFKLWWYFFHEDNFFSHLILSPFIKYTHTQVFF